MGDGGAGLPGIPDGSPPWLVALGTLAALLFTTLPFWGPALRDRLASRQSGAHRPSQPLGIEPTEPSPPPSQLPEDATPRQRQDAQMALIETMVDGLQARCDRAEERADEAEQAQTQLRAELAAAHGEISQLRKYIDRLLDRPQ